MKVFQVEQFESKQLIDEFEAIKKELAEIKANLPKQQSDLLGRKEIAEMLGGVSIQTIINWTEKGLLKSYKIGNRIYYKRDEIFKSLTPTS